MPQPRALRILQVAENCSPSIGGLEVYLDGLCEHLQSMGAQVTLVGTRMLESDAVPNKAYRVVFGAKGWAQRRQLLKSADVVHLHYFDYGWLLLAKAMSKKVVFMFHSTAALCPKGAAFNGQERCEYWSHWKQCPGCIMQDEPVIKALTKYFSFPIKRWLIHCVDATVAFSAFTLNEFRLPRVNLITHGFDLSQHEAGSQKRDSVVFLGRFMPEKGYAVLLKALALCHAKGHVLKLVLAGDGEYRQQVENLVQQLGLAAHVEFRGFVQGADKIACLQQATAVVIPSLWPETFGFVAIEAMACGAPVIASDMGGLLETAGQAGFVFPAGNAEALAEKLIQVHTDEALWQRMHEEGLALAANINTEESVARQYLDLYQEVYQRRN